MAFPVMGQKLLAFSFLQGAAFSVNADRIGVTSAFSSSGDAATRTPQAQAIELMCRCDEIPDDGVELQILKGLLTATTSSSFTIHGQALLLAVRTCYNIYLMSRSEVNQSIAKASLTQMLHVVFQRMEAGSLLVDVKPIHVEEVFGSAKIGGGMDRGDTLMHVQAFLNNVVMVATHGGQSAEEIRQTVADSFGCSPQHTNAAVTVSDSDNENEELNAMHSSFSGRHKESSQGGAAQTEGSTPTEGGGSQANLDPSNVSSHTEESVSAMLQKDAFLVFRALCKLSIRTSDEATVKDPTAVRGKVIALELLLVVLGNSGPTFRSSEKFLGAMRQYLCLSLLKNSASSIPQATQLTCSIFLSLLTKFRTSLKVEVAYFFPMVLLKPFESVPAPGTTPGPATTIFSAAQAASVAASSGAVPSLSHRYYVMRVLTEMCLDGQLLVDLFVNYDCDLESSNLFERLVNNVVRVAQTPCQLKPPSSSSLMAVDSANSYQQEQLLRQEALETVANITESMLGWYKQTSEISADAAAAAAKAMVALDEAKAEGRAGTPNADGLASPNPELGRRSSLDSFALGSLLAGEGSGQDGGSAGGSVHGGSIMGGPLAADDKEVVGAKRAYKAKFQECLALFNAKPKKGIEAFQAGGMLGNSPEEISAFLSKTQGLDKSVVGSYISEREEFNLKIMHAYVDALNFEGLEFDEIYRSFPRDSGFMEGFLKNNRGINDGQDLPGSFLEALYDRIALHEIKMKDDVAVGEQREASSQAKIIQMFFFMMGAKQQVSNEPSDESIKQTLEFLHEKAKSSTAVTVTEPEVVVPMMEVVWAPLLGALSVLFDEYTDARLVRLCLSGFASCCCLCSLVSMANLRDVFVSGLCNFTHLHQPATMRVKNALAFKHLLQVAKICGNQLQERWIDVLRCISRWELLREISSGVPTDAALFPVDLTLPSGGKGGSLDKAPSKKSMGGKDSPSFHSIESLAMNEKSIKMGNCAAGSVYKLDSSSIPDEVIFACDEDELNLLFINSFVLDSEAILVFVRALCSISVDELRDAKAPRIFSLAKIVEIAHFNMKRIRIVWSRIWAVLADYFIEVGCHSNLSVAMYAVDSLRQLAMKFLEREELTNYSFQNDFLRPFVVLMRKSTAVEVRELIIRCLSQMVLARVDKVKSGWKSMLMVFTIAAGDREPRIVLVAFETIEKIIREHFRFCALMLAEIADVHAYELPAAYFTTNLVHPMFCALMVAEGMIGDVQADELPAGPSIRFCALMLAEGEIGDVHADELPAGYSTADIVHSMRLVSVDEGSTSATATTTTPKTGQAKPGPLNITPQNSMPLLLRDPGTASCSTTAKKRGFKFMDRDEHVFYWYPLLAGLSELTFDPRPDIRNSALEVLFDTLKSHGGAFAESFWQRVFDSVLLPIFDHVRAEVPDTATFTSDRKRAQEDVTDTTTFTSDRKRAQEDAWLYETCTKCLERLVEVFVLFYADMQPSLLTKLLELLKGFMNRSNASLAASGVNAFVLLCNKAATLMNESTWTEVMSFLLQVTEEIAPCAEDLVTPPAPPRPSTSDFQVLDLNPAGSISQLFGKLSGESGRGGLGSPQVSATFDKTASGGPKPSGASASRPSSSGVGNLPLHPTSMPSGGAGVTKQASGSVGGRFFSLREGVGSRRLSKFKAQSSVQLLLVGGCTDVFNKNAGGAMPTAAVSRLLQTLHSVATHARTVDMDVELRRKIAFQQAEDGVKEECCVSDPPLLRVEMEASVAYMAALRSINAAEAGQALSTHAKGSEAVARMSALCLSILNRFAQGVAAPAAPLELGADIASSPAAPVQMSTSIAMRHTSAGLPVTMASRETEYSAFGPLLTSTLRALSLLEEDVFREILPRLFPIMTQLIHSEYAPPDVHRALAELFQTRVGSLLDSPANSAAVFQNSASWGSGAPSSWGAAAESEAELKRHKV
eukprot:gene27640-7278_t